MFCFLSDFIHTSELLRNKATELENTTRVVAGRDGNMLAVERKRRCYLLLYTLIPYFADRRPHAARRIVTQPVRLLVKHLPTQYVM